MCSLCSLCSLPKAPSRTTQEPCRSNGGNFGNAIAVGTETPTARSPLAPRRLGVLCDGPAKAGAVIGHEAGHVRGWETSTTPPSSCKRDAFKSRGLRRRRPDRPGKAGWGNSSPAVDAAVHQGGAEWRNATAQVLARWAVPRSDCCTEMHGCNHSCRCDGQNAWAGGLALSTQD